MRKSVRYALVVLLLLVAAVVVLPAVLLDKDDVKRQVSKAAYEATGRELAIGDIGVSLLPTPRVTLSEVRFANWAQSAEPWMVQIPTVTVVAAPMDLLSGKITARSVQLDSPRVLLEQRAGKNNWDFLPPGKLPQKPIAHVDGYMDVAAALTQTPKTAALGSGTGLDLVFENIELRNGVVTLQAAGQAKPLVAKDISVDVNAQSMQGPFQIKANAKALGQTLSVESIIDEIKPQRAIPLRADVAVAAINWHVDGLILRDTGKGLVFKAAVDMTVPNVAQSLSAFGVSAPAVLQNLPLKWVGDLRADTQKGAFREGRLTLGTDEVATDVSWNVEDERPALHMDFHAQHIRLDNWANAQTAALPLPKTFAALQDVLVQPAHAQTATADKIVIPKLPRGVDVNVTAQADVMTWHKQAVHGAVLDAALSGGDVVVNRLAADLPGAASLSVQGFIGTAQEVPSLDMTVDGKAANLRGTLDWLGMDVSRVPGDRLRKAGLTMAVALADDGLLHLRDIDMTLDASRARGAANLRLGGRPAVGLSLAVDRLNTDAYRLVSPVQAASVARPIYAAATTTAPSSASPFDLSPLMAMDANVQLTVGRLLAGQQAFDDVQLQGSVQGGDVTIKTATAALGVVGHVSASGRLLQQGQALPLLQDVKIGVKSNRGDRLMRLLPAKLPEFVKGWRNMNATINVDGDLSNVATNALLVVGKTRMHGVGALNLLTGQPAKDTSLTVTAPTLRDVAKVFGGSVAPEIAKIGKVTAKLPIQRTQTGYLVSNLSLDAGEIKVNGKVDVKTAGPRPFVTADLKGNTLPLVAFAEGQKIASAEPVMSGGVIPANFTPVSTSAKRQPWMVLRDFDGNLTANFDAVVSPKVRAENVKVAAHLSQGVLDVSKATANVYGGALSLVGQADVRQQPKLTGKLTAENVALRRNNPLFGKKGAPLTGLINLTAEANSTGVDMPALLKALNGHGVFKVAKGTFLGADLDEVDRLVRNIRSIDDVLRAIKAGQSGRTVFDDLTGNFNITNGVLRSENVALAAPSGKGAVTGVANLFSRTMDVKANYALASLKGAPPVGVRLKGVWTDPRVIFDIEAFQGYVLQRGIGQFLNRLGKDMGLETQKRSAQPQTDSTSTTTEQPAEPQQKIKVKDVLRGLFNAIPQN